MPKNKKKTNPKTQKKNPKAVVKQNQFRTEYKDRVSAVRNQHLSTLTGSSTNGPADSLILVPQALTKLFGQGTLNGEVDGNNINPRFLNMKVNIDFTDLPIEISANLVNYNIQIKQGFVLQDLREYLTGTHTNTSSGRVQPAFPTHTLVPGYWDSIAKKFLFNANMNPDFLSYEKKLDTQIRIIKSWRIKGDQTGSILSSSGTAGGGSFKNASPNKQYSFNWKMPKDKQLLSPALNASAVGGVAPSAMWIPFVIITMETSETLGTGNQLNISDISHFTYTDN